MKIRAIATLHHHEMNPTERAYSRYLDQRMYVGEIRWWAYEAWKFRLADNTTYTPDFIVVGNDLRIEAHEVKAEWRNGKPGWQDDARVKIKVAAEQHPVRFVAVTHGRDGGWRFEEFLKDQEEPAPMSPEEVMDRIGEALQCPGRLDRILTEIIRLQSTVQHAS